jgi:putative restriction endonuclease
LEFDNKIRIATFNWLNELENILGDVLPRSILAEGFTFQNTRIPLVSPQGIFKPRLMEIPLSITTTPDGPYDDSFDNDGLLIYRYRGTDIHHRDNVGLRNAMLKKLPLVYFHGIIRGRYLSVYPVYIVEDNPIKLSFKIAVDDYKSINSDTDVFSVEDSNIGRRLYLTRSIKQRLHQRGFREKVLYAYKTSCAICKLRHRELLDAAHIIPDHEPEGKPIIKNGLSLCKLHHAAYDSFFIGVTPDFQIKIRQDILQENDGPVLQHGLKNLHNSKLILPSSKKDWPGKDNLDWRYEKFKKAI